MKAIFIFSITMVFILSAFLFAALTPEEFKIPQLQVSGIDHGSGEAFTATLGLE